MSMCIHVYIYIYIYYTCGHADRDGHAPAGDAHEGGARIHVRAGLFFLPHAIGLTRKLNNSSATIS